MIRDIIGIAKPELRDLTAFGRKSIQRFRARPEIILFMRMLPDLQRTVRIRTLARDYNLQPTRSFSTHRNCGAIEGVFRPL